MIPGLTTGLLHAADPLAGKTFPQPFVENAGQKVLLDDLLSCDWMLYLDAHRRDWDFEALKSQTQDLPLQIAKVSDFEGRKFSKEDLLIHSPMIVQWMKAHSVCAVLVRPDKYVYGAVDDMPTALRMIDSLSSIMN